LETKSLGFHRQSWVIVSTYIACNDQMMDSAVVHLLEDPTKDWKWPKLFVLKGQDEKEHYALNLAAQMGQDFGQHPAMVYGTHITDIGSKANETGQTGVIAELFRRTDIMRFDCQSRHSAYTLLRKGGIMFFGGATIFRGAQEVGDEQYDTMSKADIIVPYIPSGMVTTDTELQIEKSLQVAIEGARKTKTAVLIIVGYNFTGTNLRSEWQQYSACAFARILLHVLLQDTN